MRRPHVCQRRRQKRHAGRPSNSNRAAVLSCLVYYTHDTFTGRNDFEDDMPAGFHSPCMAFLLRNCTYEALYYSICSFSPLKHRAPDPLPLPYLTISPPPRRGGRLGWCASWEGTAVGVAVDVKTPPRHLRLVCLCRQIYRYGRAAEAVHLYTHDTRNRRRIIREPHPLD